MNSIRVLSIFFRAPSALLHCYLIACYRLIDASSYNPILTSTIFISIQHCLSATIRQTHWLPGSRKILININITMNMLRNLHWNYRWTLHTGNCYWPNTVPGNFKKRYFYFKGYVLHDEGCLKIWQLEKFLQQQLTRWLISQASHAMPQMNVA